MKATAGTNVLVRALVQDDPEQVAAENVELNRLAAQAGLATLEAGGDFADGVIAFEGRQLGGDTFVSFDKRAVKLLKKQGYSAMEL